MGQVVELASHSAPPPPLGNGKLWLGLGAHTLGRHKCVRDSNSGFGKGMCQSKWWLKESRARIVGIEYLPKRKEKIACLLLVCCLFRTFKGRRVWQHIFVPILPTPMLFFYRLWVPYGKGGGWGGWVGP